MGDFEAGALALVESPLKYHPDVIEVLTLPRDPGRGPCMAGSLTGAVSSQRVTEEYKGKFKLILSTVERKGKYLLNCKTDMSNRNLCWS